MENRHRTRSTKPPSYHERGEFSIEVDGVAGEVALGPAPVGRLEQEAGIVDDFDVAAAAIPQGEAPSFQERLKAGKRRKRFALPCPTRSADGEARKDLKRAREPRFLVLARVLQAPHLPFCVR
jgi:hypothetical protein